MTFKKNFQLCQSQLTKNTQLRFLEIELSQALYIAKRLTNTHEEPTEQYKARSLLANLLTRSPEHQIHFNDLFQNPRFLNPSKEEKVQYFRYKNLGQKKIRQFVSVSPNDLSKGGKYTNVPNFNPIFKHWNQFEYAIYSWNLNKNLFNLWLEETPIHLTNHQTQDKYLKQTPTEVQSPIPSVTSEPKEEPTPQQPETIIPSVPSEPIPFEPLTWTVGKIYNHDEMVQLLGIPRTPDDYWAETFHISSYIFPGVIEEVEEDTTYRILKEKADVHIRSEY